MIVLYALAAAFGLGVLWLGTNLRVVKQFERGVVFRFGRVQIERSRTGTDMLIPIADRLEKVNMQIITMPIPAQDGITRDNVTVRVDAVIYFNVADPVRAAVDVQDYTSAIGQVAQTSLRSIIGKSNLDDLLSNREGLNQGMELMIDSPALGWGIHIDRVEIKDVVLPDSMKRSMSRQAEAERERRARIITADGELQASDKLAQAAEVMAGAPGRAATAALANRRRGGRREELHPGACPSRSNCSGSWKKPPRNHPGPKTRQPRRPPNRLRCPTARRRMWTPHRSPTTLVDCHSKASRASPSGSTNSSESAAKPSGRERETTWQPATPAATMTTTHLRWRGQRAAPRYSTYRLRGS